MNELKLGLVDNVDVAVWQQFLIVKGLLSGDTIRNMLDGQFGKKTEASTKEFQLAQGLTPTGTVDAETVEAAIKAGFIQRQKAAKRVAVKAVFSALAEHAQATLLRIREDHVFFAEEPFELKDVSYIARLEPHKHLEGPSLRYWHRGITVYRAN